MLRFMSELVWRSCEALSRFQRKGLESSGCCLDKEGKAVSTWRKAKIVTTVNKWDRSKKKRAKHRKFSVLKNV